MSKRTPTKTVFDRLDELADPAEVQTTHSTAEPDDADSTPEDETAAAAGETDDDEAAAPAGESDDEAAEVVSEDDETSDDRPPRRLRRRVVTALVGVVVVAVLGGSGFLGWRLKQLDETATAGQAALDAARNYAVTLTTIDAKDIDKNYQQALDGATGEFKDEYSQGATQLRKVLIDSKASGKGIVVDAAVKSVTKTKVEVLLFVDQSVTNAVNPSPRIDRNRVQMTMVRIDNRWLASKVEII